MKPSRTLRRGLIAGVLLVAGSLAVWAAPGDTNARQLIAQFSAQAASKARTRSPRISQPDPNTSSTAWRISSRSPEYSIR